MISTSVDSKRAVEALAAIRAEYANIVAEGVPEPVLTALITKLLGEIQESLRQSEGAARLVRAAMLAGYPDDHYATLEARVRGLTAADINDGLRTKFPKAPLAVVIIAPSANGFDADCVIKSPSEIGRCE